MFSVTIRPAKASQPEFEAYVRWGKHRGAPKANTVVNLGK